MARNEAIRSSQFNWYLKSQRVNWWAPAAVTFCLMMSYWRSGYKAVLYNLSFHSMAALREGRCFPLGEKRDTHTSIWLESHEVGIMPNKACSPGKKVGGKLCGSLSRSGCWMESCIQETWDDCSKLNFWHKWVLSKLGTVSMPVIQPSESSCLSRVVGLKTSFVPCSGVQKHFGIFWSCFCQLCDKKLKCLWKWLPPMNLPVLFFQRYLYDIKYILILLYISIGYMH